VDAGLRIRFRLLVSTNPLDADDHEDEQEHPHQHRADPEEGAPVWAGA
jgi:hypothetical protein